MHKDCGSSGVPNRKLGLMPVLSLTKQTPVIPLTPKPAGSSEVTRSDRVQLDTKSSGN